MTTFNEKHENIFVLFHLRSFCWKHISKTYFRRV